MRPLGLHAPDGKLQYIATDFRPLSLRNLGNASASEEQQFDVSPGGGADNFTRQPQPPDLAVIKGALPGLLIGRGLNADARRCQDYVLLAEPSEELREGRQRPVSHHRTALGHMLDQLPDVTALDFVDDPAGPGRQ